MFNRGVLIHVRHFPCKFPHKMARVKCPCAFRLRRLAQNDVPGLGSGIFLVNFDKMALVKCPCEQKTLKVDAETYCCFSQPFGIT